MFGFLVFFLRKSLHESSYYIKNKLKNEDKGGSSLVKILSQNRLKFLLALLLSGGIGASYNFLIIFLGTFVADVLGAISRQDAAKSNIILIIVYAVSCLISGFLADRMSVYKQIFVSLLMIMCLVFTMQLFSLDNMYSFPLHIVLVFFVPIYMIPIQIKLQSMFSADIRVRCVSLAHSLGSMFLSSTIPFICMLLWKYTESFSVVCLYFMGIVLLIIGSVFITMQADYKNMFEI